MAATVPEPFQNAELSHFDTDPGNKKGPVCGAFSSWALLGSNQ